ncbi:MAG TPA: efflux RND transporter permease subunit, partial [Spirochaetota bacterium]|nr:efflux RND transporter permease subunit [Spirochaetota bacterium]
MAGIFLFGLAALFTLKIELLPAIDIPRLTVVTAYSSGSAAETENLITLNVEEALSAVNGVNSVRSVSLSEMSITELSFNYGYSLNRAVIDIRKKLDFIKNKLPREAERPVIIRAPDAAGTILTIAAVNTGLPERFFAQEIRKNIKGALKRTAGVSSVTIKGLRQRQIHIKTKPEKLKAHNLTITELSRLISSHNASYPAGMIKLKNTEIPVKINAAITNIHILRNLPLQSGNNGAVVQLKDIAAVTYGKERPADFASLNSKPVVLLKTCKRFRANTLDVCRHAFTTINNLKQKYENKIRFTITYNQADYISRSLKQLIAALLIGILLGFAVLYLFFRDLATALLITAVIPLSFFIIFLLMYIFNITINLITLGGMALGAGMVIDASILAVYALSGIDFSRKNIIDAMLHKLKVIFPSIFTSVLSTIAVFIPVIFLKGLISEVFRDMALVIIFSLSASLIISMSFIPLLFYLFNTRFAFFKKKISFTAHNRAALFWSDQAGKIKKNIFLKTVLICILFISFSVFIVIDKKIIPFCETNVMKIKTKLPASVNINTARRAEKELAEQLLKKETIKHIFSTCGRKDKNITALNKLKDKNIIDTKIIYKGNYKKIKKTVTGIIKAHFRKEYPAALITITPRQPPFTQTLQVNEQEKYITVSKRRELNRLLYSNQQQNKNLTELEKKEFIKFNNIKTASLQITKIFCARELAAHIKGDKNNYIIAGNNKIPLKIWSGADQLDDLQNIPIKNRQGHYTYLGNISHTYSKMVPKALFRVNGQAAALLNKKQAAVLKKKEADSDRFRLMDSLNQRDIEQSYQNFIISFLISLFLVYMVLAVQFNSFKKPFYIFLQLLPCLSAAAWALFLT